LGGFQVGWRQLTTICPGVDDAASERTLGTRLVLEQTMLGADVASAVVAATWKQYRWPGTRVPDPGSPATVKDNCPGSVV
jgi:hypothetical protein